MVVCEASALGRYWAKPFGSAHLYTLLYILLNMMPTPWRVILGVRQEGAATLVSLRLHRYNQDNSSYITATLEILARYSAAFWSHI